MKFSWILMRMRCIEQTSNTKRSWKKLLPITSRKKFTKSYRGWDVNNGKILGPNILFSKKKLVKIFSQVTEKWYVKHFLKRYFSIEKKFHKFSQQLSLPKTVVDLMYLQRGSLIVVIAPIWVASRHVTSQMSHNMCLLRDVFHVLYNVFFCVMCLFFN